MINIKTLKNITAVAVILCTLTACPKKKDDAPKVEEPVTTPAPCFSSNNNGVYHGSGFTLASPFTSGTLTVTRTSCQVITFNLTTDSAGQIIGQASQLVLNSNGSYQGKQNNNNDITLTFGSVLNINAVNSFTYTGTKQ